MNTISPKISIITATLNNLPGLQKTTSSIQSQTFRDFEHVVVDGGSSDGTVEWLATNSDSIRWLSEPDSGIADAMNKGLSMATGEWILFLHSEDALVDDDSLEQAMRTLETGADIVSYHVEVVKGARSRIYKSHGFSWRINFKTIPHQGAFCRRLLFDRLGSFDPRFHVAMDYEFFLRAHRSGAIAEAVDLVIARMPDTGVSSLRDWQSLSQRFEEEKDIHRLHVDGPVRIALYVLYWSLYLPYRWIREAIEGWLATGRHR